MIVEPLLKKYETKERKLIIIEKAIIKMKDYYQSENYSKLKRIVALVEMSVRDELLKDDLLPIIKMMMEHNFINNVAKLLKNMYSQYGIECYSNERLWILMDLSLCVMCNFCEHSGTLCDEIYQSEITEIVIDILSNTDYVNRVRYIISTEFRKLYSYKLIDRNDIKFVTDSRIYWSITACCCIVHNVIIYYDIPKTTIRFNVPILNDNLIKYSKMSNSEILNLTTFSAFVVINSYSENHYFNNDVFIIGAKLIKIMFTLIKYELNRTPDQIMSEFRIWEMLNVLFCACKCESFLEKIISADGLKTICEVVDKSTKPNEVKYAMLLLQKLAENSLWFKLSINCLDIEKDLICPLKKYQIEYQSVVDYIFDMIN